MFTLTEVLLSPHTRQNYPAFEASFVLGTASLRLSRNPNPTPKAETGNPGRPSLLAADQRAVEGGGDVASQAWLHSPSLGGLKAAEGIGLGGGGGVKGNSRSSHKGLEYLAAEACPEVDVHRDEQRPKPCLEN